MESKIFTAPVPTLSSLSEVVLPLSTLAISEALTDNSQVAPAAPWRSSERGATRYEMRPDTSTRQDVSDEMRLL